MLSSASKFILKNVLILLLESDDMNAGHDIAILLLSFWKLRNFDAHRQ